MEVCRRRKGLKKHSENSWRKASGGGRRSRKCCLEASKSEAKMSPKILPKCTQGGSEILQKCPPGPSRNPPGSPWGPPREQGLKLPIPFWPPQGGSGGLRGEKKFTGFCRGGSRKVLGPFFNVLRRPRSDFGLHFASPGGGPGGPFWRLFQKTRKPWILHTFRVKSRVF